MAPRAGRCAGRRCVGGWRQRALESLGQATVEAAVLIPSLMVLLAMLLQPAFVLYTRAAMQQAAAEGLRVLATQRGDGLEACKAYVLRRLSAVPDVAPFHVGGEQGWEVEVSGGGDADAACVAVTGRLRPLPLLGVLASALGEVDGEEVVLRVSAQERTRPDWLEGGYGDWIAVWG